MTMTTKTTTPTTTYHFGLTARRQNEPRMDQTVQVERRLFHFRRQPLVQVHV